MKNRLAASVFTGLLVAGVTALAAPGCGRSVAGEYRKICIATCQTLDDCEGYPGFLPVDREDCMADCDDDSIDFANDVQKQCEDQHDVVVIDGVQVDRCYNAIVQLGGYCRSDNESKLGDGIQDYGDECLDPGDPLYECQ